MSSVNAIIGLDRWTSQFTFEAGGGAWDPDRPVSNIGSMPLYRVGRTVSGNVSDTVFIARSQSLVPVGLMAFVGHDADAYDTFDVEMFSDYQMQQPINSLIGEEFWPRVYDQSAIPFEHESFWTGKLSARQRKKKRTPIRPIWIPSPVLLRSIKVTMRRFQPSVGPFRLRMFEICLGHQVSINPSFGMNYGFNFRTTSLQAACGHKEFNRLPKAQTWKGTIDYLPTDEARQRMYDALEEYDLDTPFLFFPFPSREVDWLRMCNFVRNTDPGSYRIVAGEHDEVPFSFEGVL
ncbi:hypothetical protein TSA6c_16965 [Azospirillum sp. TSA6c]|uniref:hypothetical protein n=1 Tax=Azospirillum sp. TSA6c TaxID=709813 RepID=UPI000D61E7EA|nr:hypothetical protein [Azospirillum sp. TSA6c]PWC48127.1 hypothetical protein TSA6c_16965 [Azospirillum sp. TSA6c]